LTQEEFCRTVGISRTSLWRYAQGKRERVAPPIKRKSDNGWQKAARKQAEKHPAFGYRMLHVMLKRDGVAVGQHRLRKWMRLEGLSQRPAIVDDGRTPGPQPPEPTGPDQAWQIDATKIHTHSDGWVWQTSVLDVFDRRIVSYIVRKTCRSEDGQDALALALDASYGYAKATGLSVIHDRGSQFTSHGFIEMVRNSGARNVPTAVHHPESCGRLERFHKTLKQELIWQNEWLDLAEVQHAVADWVLFYNKQRPHSALGYQTPLEFNRAAALLKRAA
jgi:putative transposase